MLTVSLILILFTKAGASDNAATVQSDLYWIKAHAANKFERSRIADTGVTIESVQEDYVIALGSVEQRDVIEKLGIMDTSFQVPYGGLDFPDKDANFHNYSELETALRKLASEHPDIASLDSIGQSVEGREIFRIRIGSQKESLDSLPAAIFMGAHHAREHLSVEIPLLLAQHLVTEYSKGNERIVRLVDSRDIHIIPMVNPDGAEYDIASGSYRMWRKNRRTNGNGTFGVDLNRNYSYMWGTGGSSSSGSSDVYMGPKPFSEPETLAVKNLIENQQNASVLLSFHTFSELILYPWGHSYTPIANDRDLKVFETMAKTMAKWNGYKAQASSDLYIASGDTVDWAYGEHGVFAYTFELDPRSLWDGGFYPGQAVIPVVFKKNLEPCLYMIELADNPYRVLEPTSTVYGLSSPLIQ